MKALNNHDPTSRKYGRTRFLQSVIVHSSLYIAYIMQDRQLLAKNKLKQQAWITVFTRISAAALIKFFAPQMRRLFEGGAYLKIGRDKEIFSFNLKVYFLSVRKFYSN